MDMMLHKIKYVADTMDFNAQPRPTADMILVGYQALGATQNFLYKRNFITSSTTALLPGLSSLLSSHRPSGSVYVAKIYLVYRF